MDNFTEVLMARYAETNNYGRVNGMELLSYKNGYIEYRMIITKDHLATPTTAHGGIIAGYMDSVIGVAALTESSKNMNLVSTVEFKINYLKPARVGDVLLGIGEVVSAGKRIIIAKGEIKDEKTGDTIAIATGTFNAYPYQKSGMTL
ncbi:MAG: PaaI family thioesterase [Crocinitomicaceae bacterium]